MNRRPSGFTLIELLIVIVIIGIGLSIAIPGFQGMSARNQIAYRVNDLLTALNMARSEAMRRGSLVTIQSIDSSDNTNEFGGGYCVQIGAPTDTDYSDSCTYDASLCPAQSGCILRDFEGVTGGTKFDSEEGVGAITFGSLGNLEGGAILNLDLCTPGEEGRRIRIDLSGRSRSHKPDDPDSGKQPTC